MIPSRFTIRVPDFPAPGRTLLFHARTQAQVVVDAGTMAWMDRLPEAPAPSVPGERLASLRRLGFLAESSGEEDAVLERWMAGLRADRGVLRPVVLTTYACNFACTYCVENGVRDPVHMDGAAARRTVSYIMARAAALAARRIEAVFYGGEPLCHPEALEAVARGVRDAAGPAGIPFCFHVITNGSLMTAQRVRSLLPIGLTGVKFTLDGDREAHDRKRPFADGSGSFDAVVGNLRAVADLVPVSLGCNFDAENASAVPAMLSLLAEYGLAGKLGRISFKPVSRTAADRAAAGSAELPCAYQDMESVRRSVALRRAAADLGFRTDEGVGVHRCDALGNSSSFVVDPMGVLYRCPAFVGRAGFECGAVATGEKPSEDPQLWRRCSSCAYVPLCGDGCIFGAYLRYGDPYRLNCDKEAMEYMVAEALKDNYRRKHPS